MLDQRPRLLKLMFHFTSEGYIQFERGHLQERSLLALAIIQQPQKFFLPAQTRTLP